MARTNVKSIEKRQDKARKRWAQARALRDTGLFSKKKVAELIGVSESLIHHYSKFDTFEAFQALNNEKAKERTAKRESLQAVGAAEKALEQEISRIEAERRTDKLSDESTEITGENVPEVYDPLARMLIAEIEQKIADITDRLNWIEGNAVIDTTRHKNPIKFFGRTR